MLSRISGALSRRQFATKPVHVTVTGAAGQIGYALLPMIASGQMFGPNTPVVLQLVDLPHAMEMLKGNVMEIEDGYFPLVQDVITTSDPAVGFKNADAAVMLGAFPRKAGMERKDLMEKNVGIFKVMGEAIEASASPDIKVLVVGNPANTNALACSVFAPKVPKQNFTALTRLDHNRALAMIAQRANKNVGDVRNLVIWGNHSSTQYPDVTAGVVGDVSIAQAIQDEAWLRGAFIESVQKRGAAIIKARQASSALSAARASVLHMHDWFNGTKEGEFVSMGVYTDGSDYNVGKDLIYSLPCKCVNGQWEVVKGLEISDFSRQMMVATEQELMEERAIALEICGA